MGRATFVVALAIEPSDSLMLDDRIGTARKYPWHLTIKGRFQADEAVAESILVPRLVHLAGMSEPFTVGLGPPQQITSALWWRECGRCAPGHGRLRSLHAWCERNIVHSDIYDLTYPMHKGANYRPHATVAWRPDGTSLTAAERMTMAGQARTLGACVGHPILIQYDGDPHSDEVSWRTIFSEV